MVIEQWKEIPGFPGYLASNLGRIKAIKKQSWNHNANANVWRKERLLQCNYVDPSGYLVHTINLGRNLHKRMLAHRLICLAFHENPENKRFVNHKNGIKTDNRSENLEWCTSSENGIHAVRTGLHKPLRGEENGNSKVTKDIVIAIRLEKNLTQWQMAKKYCIGRTTVQYIQQRKLWAHI